MIRDLTEHAQHRDQISVTLQNIFSVRKHIKHPIKSSIQEIMMINVDVIEISRLFFNMNIKII